MCSLQSVFTIRTYTPTHVHVHHNDFIKNRLILFDVKYTMGLYFFLCLADAVCHLPTVYDIRVVYNVEIVQTLNNCKMLT